MQNSGLTSIQGTPWGVHVLHKNNVKLSIFTPQPCSDLKQTSKKHDASAELLFCQSKPIAFLLFSLTLPLSLLKLPIVRRKLMLITQDSSKWPNRSHRLYMCNSLCYIPGGRGAFFWINTTATLVFWSCRLLLLRKRTRVNQGIVNAVRYQSSHFCKISSSQSSSSL